MGKCCGKCNEQTEDPPERNGQNEDSFWTVGNFEGTINKSVNNNNNNNNNNT